MVSNFGYAWSGSTFLGGEEWQMRLNDSKRDGSIVRETKGGRTMLSERAGFQPVPDIRLCFTYARADTESSGKY